jgi:hypothetical protein
MPLKMKEYKINEIYSSEMNTTGQKIIIIEMSEVSYTDLPNEYRVASYGMSKKFVIAKNSTLFPEFLAKANKDEYVSIVIKDFRFRNEVRNGRSEEIVFHKTVYIEGDNLEDFPW